MPVKERVMRQQVRMLLEPGRLDILTVLSHEPKYLSELAEKARLSRTDVSYHLGVLENAGLVRSEYRILKVAKAGRKGKAARYYYLNEERFLDVIGNVLTYTVALLTDFKKALKKETKTSARR